jgi:outer membrane protein assembly factor BamB
MVVSGQYVAPTTIASFENSTEGWIGSNFTGGPWPVDEWASNGRRGLKANVTLKPWNCFWFKNVKLQSFAGKQMLRATINKSSWGVFGDGIVARLYIKTGSSWTWHEGTLVEILTDASYKHTGTELTLDLRGIANLNEVHEIGVQVWVKTGCSEDASIYLDDVRVYETYPDGTNTWWLPGPELSFMEGNYYLWSRTNIRTRVDLSSGLNLYTESFELPVHEENGIRFYHNDGTFRAVDAATNSQIWSVQIPAFEYGLAVHANAVNAPVIIADSKLIAALDFASGSILWQRSTTISSDVVFPNAVDIVVLERHANGITDIISIDRVVGTEKWSTSLPIPVYHTNGQVFQNNMIVYNLDIGRIFCCNLLTGAEVWQQNYGTAIILPIVNTNSVFVSVNDELICYDWLSGAQQWRQAYAYQWTFFAGAIFINNRTDISRLNMASGNVEFTITLENRSPRVNFVNNQIEVRYSNPNETVIYSPGTGLIIRRYQNPDPNYSTYTDKLGNTFRVENAPPNPQISLLDPVTNEPVWSFSIARSLFNAEFEYIADADVNATYICLVNRGPSWNNTTVIALNRENGTARWVKNLLAGATYVAADADRIYFNAMVYLQGNFALGLSKTNP